MPNPLDSWLLMAMAIGAAVIMTFFWLRHWGVFSIFKRFTGKSAEERTGEILSSYLSNLSHNVEADPNEASPFLRPLRAIQTDTEVKCYFGNRGGIAYNLSIMPQGNVQATVMPTDRLPGGETGIISLKELSASPIDIYQFALSYTDSNRQQITRHFFYSKRDGDLKEI